MKDIYNLELHESKFIPAISVGIIRVAGGWIYEKRQGEHSLVVSSVFVPFNNEFQGNITNKIFKLERKIDELNHLIANPEMIKVRRDESIRQLKKLKDEKTNRENKK